MKLALLYKAIVANEKKVNLIKNHSEQLPRPDILNTDPESFWNSLYNHYIQENPQTNLN